MNLKKSNFRGKEITIGLMAINIIVFLISAWMSKSLDISILALVQLGGSVKALVAEGEVWRLFTSMFLHGSISHLAFNMYALWIYGNVLESVLKKWQYLLLYFLTGIAGAVLSYFTMDLRTVSVGASGAIFGLLGVLIGYTLTMKGLFRKGALTQLLTIALINLVLGFTPGSGIDNFAHLGGLVAGFILSIIIKPTRR